MNFNVFCGLHMTVSPTESSTRSPGDGSSLEHLHKMSRTAGLGTTDYVAVNTIAVTTLILGLLSGLSLLGTAMLVLPVATLAVGIIAILQIRRSAGTQSGLPIAGLGILIALLFVGIVGGKEVLHDRKESLEQGQIEALIDKLGKAIVAKDYATAWNCFDEKVQAPSSQAAFADLWEKIQGSPVYGRVTAMHSNGIVSVADERDNGVLRARGFVIVTLAGGHEDRRDSVFTKAEGGNWLFEDIQGFSPPPLVKPAAERSPQ